MSEVPVHTHRHNIWQKLKAVLPEEETVNPNLLVILGMEYRQRCPEYQVNELRHQKQAWRFSPQRTSSFPPDDLNLRLSGKSSRLNATSLNRVDRRIDTQRYSEIKKPPQEAVF